jgi:hypothetical protein
VSIVAMQNNLFWIYRWLDIPMHLSGGFITGALAASFARTYRPWVFVCIILCVIVGWEVFEALTKAPQESPYITDTLLDLVCGSAGAGIAWALARRVVWRSH